MFSVEVRDRIIIAHSLPASVFGPAQGPYGATLVIDVAFFREELGEHNVVVDIATAHDVLRDTLNPLSYRNLDEMEEFRGVLTTAEYLCKYIFDNIADAARSGALAARRKISPKSVLRFTRPALRGHLSRAQ